MRSQDYIPWNAVATNWANRRAVWARRLRDCMDTSGVVKHLLQLEQEQPSPLTHVLTKALSAAPHACCILPCISSCGLAPSPPRMRDPSSLLIPT